MKEEKYKKQIEKVDNLRMELKKEEKLLKKLEGESFIGRCFGSSSLGNEIYKIISFHTEYGENQFYCEKISYDLQEFSMINKYPMSKKVIWMDINKGFEITNKQYEELKSKAIKLKPMFPELHKK